VTICPWLLVAGPIAKIVPFTIDDDGQNDADLVAAGLVRKGTAKLPASF
jgi:hypothetical protein